MIEKIERTEEEWKRILTPEQYSVLRQGKTEPAFSCFRSKHGYGTYNCAACNIPLFRSETKFDSKTGWPSYFKPIDYQLIEEREDFSFSIKRTEVVCARCGSHLGHVFNDDPLPTGKRYCINSISLFFKSDE
jgi:peptide-methionine (R)-S-oxide reductase